ncbi:MAG TPA: DUF4412 domain-containing protein [Myxococcaceae bacterium]|jgi:hypothetical protein|nr:DUF4412 domain-containing protein [Myxococcaceae bacterium]
MGPALWLLLALSAAPAPEFEGILEMKLLTDPTAKGGWTGGTVRILVSRAGMRSEVVAQTTRQPFQMVSLVRASEPTVTYTLDEASKTYQRLDNTGAGEPAGEAPTLKRLGQEKILGRTVEHVLLTSTSKGKEEEIWVDTSLLPPARFVSAFERDGGDAWWTALKAAGLEGIPLKMIFRSTAPGSKQTGVEATSIERKRLPDSTFDVPAGYREAKGPGE